MSRGKTREKPYKPSGIILRVNVVNDAARYVYCLKMQENAARASRSCGGPGQGGAGGEGGGR